MSTRASKVFSLVLLAALWSAACGKSTGPVGDPEGDLDVEFFNFTSVSASMGLVGGSTVVVAGNPFTGNPTIYKVTSPGAGNSLEFTATWSNQTQNVTCTVTNITGVSIPPSVIVQPIGQIGFLECSAW